MTDASIDIPEPRLPVVWHEAYEVDIGPHVFPTRKYRLVRDQLIAKRTIAASDVLRPDPATDEQVGLVHTTEYLDEIRTGTLSLADQLTLEVPFSPALRDAMWLCAGGSTLVGQLALRHGIAVHLGGGFHHAFADHGEGFCLINDVAIAVRVLLREGVIDRAAVIDCDVHQGNGTAAIFAPDASVFTCSFHQERNYPAWKPPSDLDVGLDDGTGDEEYHALIDEHIPSILAEHRPEVIFYLAGADPYRQDQLGGLGLTMQGLHERDEKIFRYARDAGVPVAVTLAGGYAIHQADTVEIHCGTVRAAAEAT